MKIMLVVWCFMVFGAVGERLAVAGKREGGEMGGGVERGSTLCITFAYFFFLIFLF